MVKFSYTILYVKNVVQAIEFYENAFGLERRFLHESKDYAELETGGTTLAFATNDLARSNLPEGFLENDRDRPPAGIEVGFVADDVSAVYEKAIKAGAIALVEPKVKPWGQTVAYIRDLDGILIELCTSM